MAISRPAHAVLVITAGIPSLNAPGCRTPFSSGNKAPWQHSQLRLYRGDRACTSREPTAAAVADAGTSAAGRGDDVRGCYRKPHTADNIYGPSFEADCGRRQALQTCILAGAASPLLWASGAHPAMAIAPDVAAEIDDIVPPLPRPAGKVCSSLSWFVQADHASVVSCCSPSLRLVCA